MEDNKFILVSGPMFAGKSKYLIDNYYDLADKEAFMPAINDRENEITSRADKRTIHCTKITKASELLKSQAKNIIVDEYQFLDTPEALADVVVELKKEHNIIMTGLDLLADRTEWANYTAMKKLANKEIKLKARCEKCGGEASFSKMINGNKGKKIQIENGHVRYEPRCERCFDL